MASTFDLDAQLIATIYTTHLSIRLGCRNLRSMLLFHLGQARTSMLCYASFSHLTNSTFPFPSSLHLACSLTLLSSRDTWAWWCVYADQRHWSTFPSINLLFPSWSLNMVRRTVVPHVAAMRPWYCI
jgi:hypothetical protein